MKRVNLLILCVVLLFACKKTDQTDGPFPYTNYTFTNKTEVPVTIRVFVDSGEYSEGGKCIYLSAAPGKQVVIPYNSLNPNSSPISPRFAYYWSSLDNAISSWGANPNAYPRFSYNKSVQSYNMDIMPKDASDDAAYLLTGIDGGTKWKAIDAFDISGNSIWATLVDSQKLLSMSFQWSKHLCLTRKYSTTSVKDSLFFSCNTLHGTGNVLLQTIPYVANLNDEVKTIEMIKSSSSLPAITNNYDRLYLTINNKQPYYLMEKVK